MKNKSLTINNITNNLYEYWYLSRLQILIGVVILTAVCNSVLLGYIDFKIILILFLCTALIYWFDDVIDHYLEKQNKLELTNQYVLIKGIFLLLLSLVLIITSIEIINIHPILIILGIVCVLFVTLSLLNLTIFKTPCWYIFKIIFEASIWSFVPIFIPIIYTNNQINVKTIMTYLFVWSQIAIIITLWLIADRESNGQYSSIEIFKKYKFSIFTCLKVLCIIAIISAILCTYIGLFPWFNIFVLIFPIINFLFIKHWDSANEKRKYVELIIISNMVASIMIIFFYN